MNFFETQQKKDKHQLDCVNQYLLLSNHYGEVISPNFLQSDFFVTQQRAETKAIILRQLKKLAAALVANQKTFVQALEKQIRTDQRPQTEPQPQQQPQPHQHSNEVGGQIHCEYSSENAEKSSDESLSEQYQVHRKGMISKKIVKRKVVTHRPTHFDKRQKLQGETKGDKDDNDRIWEKSETLMTLYE